MLTAQKYRFDVAANTELSLPGYIGSTLRGGFGHAFRKVSCTLRQQECNQCMLREACPYSYVFETPTPASAARMRKYTNVPHPFVIEVPGEKITTVAPGELFSYNLILIGKANELLPFFVYALRMLGEHGIGRGRGKYNLASVMCGQKTVYRDSEETILTVPMQRLPGKTDYGDWEGEVTLRFLTPTRIVSGERFLRRPVFRPIVSALIRRITMLAYFHCGHEIRDDFRGLLDQAETVETVACDTHWHNWSRYSSRQETKIDMSGFVGTVTFAGKIGRFLPYLRTGEMVHVGKGTAFGLGGYEMLMTGKTSGRVMQ